MGLTWCEKAWADALWRVRYKSKLPDFRQTRENMWRELSAVKVVCTVRCVVHTVNMEGELMEHVRCRPLLYDLSNREYRNQNVRKKAWDEIVEKFEILSQYMTVVF
jgi:hypothetical protein